MFSIFKIELYLHGILLSLHDNIFDILNSFWFPGEKTPIVVNHAPHDGSDVRKQRN